LFLHALCNGWIGEDTTVVEASSGSTAVSEAYFPALLGLPFIAVMPAATSVAKVALIESHGGRCHFVQNSSRVYAEAARIAEDTGGHYLGQFTNAERATDWRGNNNIAESIYAQMRDETHPIPEWIVVGAGTGGTNMWGAFGLLAEMVADGRSGSVVTLLADSGDRYADTYFSDEWVTTQGLDPTAHAQTLIDFEHSGRWA
jgi:cysteine synthase